MVVFSSASGGIGVSTFAAMCARTLMKRDRTCVVVDMDFSAGGIDVLLGQESEGGLRWSGVSAPLGRIEPESLLHELPQWEGLPMLASDPWNDGHPDWWEVEAAVDALTQCRDVVMVDAGHATDWRKVPIALHVMLVELSVLGLARARGALARMRDAGAHDEEGAAVMPSADAPLLLVGVRPFGAGRGGVVTERDAKDYLKVPLAGVIRRKGSLGKGLLAGLGISRIPRRYRRLLDDICDRVEERCCDGRRP
ncbi:hypothetical protein KIH77_06120 [Bifidobacterium sp. 82T24]|uniref:hypothetical protein n=1 Tax=Bifidobacterium pluvialisilvae TaxID=2834436 RepID=UPI001C563A70|nr:hypothetical protein [Bifidobacterium pluvialisilvae]MBW3088304.1 hypothetical protein [Bifidobacterium pluvialisilvae]